MLSFLEISIIKEIKQYILLKCCSNAQSPPPPYSCNTAAVYLVCPHGLWEGLLNFVNKMVSNSLPYPSLRYINKYTVEGKQKDKH
jgi:hypothetical protein